ncbi:MAG: cytochrome c-type biogenesis protein CcmH [Aquimonas sp.]|nr:cytochrome c-type biogenesis protein CcmH [Aquimonas sp.]
MTVLRRLLAAVLVLLLALPAWAIDPLPFRDEAEHARFRALTKQLRCVMCQNESLSDSSAMIAQDLRREVLTLMQQGMSDDEIKAFLAERYTDFVLYRPPFDRTTWLLWFGPGLLLLAGGVTVGVVIARRKRALDESEEPLKPVPDEEW